MSSKRIKLLCEKYPTMTFMVVNDYSKLYNIQFSNYKNVYIEDVNIDSDYTPIHREFFLKLYYTFRENVNTNFFMSVNRPVLPPYRIYDYPVKSAHKYNATTIVKISREHDIQSVDFIKMPLDTCILSQTLFERQIRV